MYQSRYSYHKFSSSFLFLFLFFLIFSSSTYAATTTLPQINVLGDGVEDINTVPGSAAIITEEVLQQTQPYSTNEVLRKISGISVREEEGQGLRPNISIRGVYGNRSQKVLLLEDGVPVALAPYGAPDAYYAPQINRVQSIEVLKGSGSILYGPQTISGVINYQTYQPTKRSSFYSKVGLGNNDETLLQTRYSNTFDSTGVVIDLLHKQGNGPRDPMPFKQYDISAKIVQDINDVSDLSVKFHYYNEDTSSTYTGLTQSLYESNYLSNPATSDKLYVERMGVSLIHKYYGIEESELTSILYAHQTKRFWWRQDYDLADDGETTYIRETKVNDVTQLYWKNSNGGRNRVYKVVGFEPRFETKEFTVGTRLHYEIEDNKRVNGSFPSARTGTIKSDEERSTLAASLYGNYHYTFGKLKLTPGVRLEAYNQRRQVYTVSDTTLGSTGLDIEVIPGVGLTYDYSDSVNIFAGIHRGFAPPKFSDSIDSSGVDQKLNAERSINIEAGTRLNLTDWLQSNVTAFYYDYSNQIIAASESSGYSKANGGKSLSQGVEVDFVSTCTDFIIDQSTWSASLATAYISSTFQDTDRKGKYIPYVPKGSLTAGLGFSHPIGIDLFGEGVYVTSMYSDEDNTITGSANGKTGLIPSHTIFNVNGKYRFDENWRLFGSVKNLMNLKYIASRHPKGIFPGLARHYMFGFETDF